MKISKFDSARKWMLIICILFFAVSACKKKNNEPQFQINQTKGYGSEVAIKWLEMQWKIFIQARGVDENPSRHLAYTGIALYESVLPGMPGYQSLSGQLIDMPVMPQIQPGITYHWPTCANAALAFMHKNLLPNTSAANKASMDSLENALNVVYQGEVDAAEFQRSLEFGQAVAQRVFDWSKTDGFLTVYPTYVPPVGPGLWESTPPAFPAASGPYWGLTKVLMPGVLNATSPAPPIPYSIDPSSSFFRMVKEVYDANLTLTPDQRTQAFYWRIVPLPPWVYILTQVLREQQSTVRLDIAALAFCKMGIATNDARIACWKAKYQFNQLRPVTYIRRVMGYTTWNSLSPTSPSPEYPSGHATFNSAAAGVLSSVFGSSYNFTDHSRDYLGYPPINFNSFRDAAVHGGYSRFYLGMNCKPSVEAGLEFGNKTAEYMNSTVKFLK